MVLPIGMHI